MNKAIKSYDAGTCDVAVIGAGHAGIEAALAAARLGMDTVCFTVNMDSVGNMPCNPAIGGTGKGHLVRELDALGGEMARAADRACIQYRMLNLGKGPAVYSLRAQADRRRYQEVMKQTLEQQENLRMKQAEVVEIRVENDSVHSVLTSTGAEYFCQAEPIWTDVRLSGNCSKAPARTGSPLQYLWQVIFEHSVCPCAVLRRERRRESMRELWIFQKWKSSGEMRNLKLFPFPLKPRRKTGQYVI